MTVIVQCTGLLFAEFSTCMASSTQLFLELAAQGGRRAVLGTDFRIFLDELVQGVCDLFHVELSSVLQLGADGNWLFLAGVGWNDKVVSGAPIELSGDSATATVVRSMTPLVITDYSTEENFSTTELFREHGIRSSLLIPLIGRDRPHGVLGVYSTQPRSYSDQEVTELQVLGNILSFALEMKEHSHDERSQKLLRAEQMMAIGQVAAGVAHELRNPLTSIKGLVQVNLRELTSRGLPGDDLAVIEHEIRRMERTLQTFLDFARPPLPNRQISDLASIVERVLSLVGGRARKQDVALEFVPPPTAVTALVDHDQIQQLLLNLVINALDAMPRGGRIEVDLQPPRDGFIELSIRDNGPGISAQILPKVFETFVSSKETGVGLGLPLSKRIAEDHGGSLAAYNLPDAGASFVLRLPAT